MPKRKAAPAVPAAPLIHGAPELPFVVIDDFNNERRDKHGFIGDRVNKRMFQQRLDAWRRLHAGIYPDPFDDVPTTELAKKKIDSLLTGEDVPAAALVQGAVEDFSVALAEVIRLFLAEKGWQKTEQIVVGGGFRNSRVGELAIARTELLLRRDGIDLAVRPIVHHPDKAGLIGALYLVPPWMLKGHNAVLAVDIGGTNVRAGIVEFGKPTLAHLSEAKVEETVLWRHADDRPSRTATVRRLVDMLAGLTETARARKLKLAPIIGIGCPGVIEPDGSIDRGGQNLPGGTWESDHFNLPKALMEAIPEIGGHASFVMMHNDAVVQGLSQIPFMTGVARWGVLTIGTGLGNARFTNRAAPDGKDG